MRLVLLALLVLSSSLRADDVAAAIKRFYVELRAVDIRGTLDNKSCDDSLTPDFRSQVEIGRQRLEEWRQVAAVSKEVFKLPFTEGTIFTDVYESAEYVQTDSIAETQNRAYVTVRLRYTDPKIKIEWQDLVILHRIDGAWKIDDILSGSDKPSPKSIRTTFDIEIAPKPTNRR